MPDGGERGWQGCAHQTLDAYAREMYARVNAKWDMHRHEIFGGACGFSILSGPPLFRPPMMSLGGNPGFGQHDSTPHIENEWPEHSFIGNADWDLEKKLDWLFKQADSASIRMESMHANFLLFKSASISRSSRYRWLDLPRPLRTELERFSRNLMECYIHQSQPRSILVLGLGIFDSNADRTPKPDTHYWSGRRRLVVEGSVFGVRALSIPHPTGARVSKDDWERVAEFLRGWL